MLQNIYNNIIKHNPDTRVMCMCSLEIFLVQGKVIMDIICNNQNTRLLFFPWLLLSSEFQYFFNQWQFNIVLFFLYKSGCIFLDLKISNYYIIIIIGSNPSR